MKPEPDIPVMISGSKGILYGFETLWTALDDESKIVLSLGGIEPRVFALYLQRGWPSLPSVKALEGARTITKEMFLAVSSEITLSVHDALEIARFQQDANQLKGEWRENDPSRATLPGAD
jgi:hypothetical protein